jgi:mono/diheme cytochrome c family protein
MSPAELLEQLHSPERWTRAQAKRLLFDAPTAAVVPAADKWTETLDRTAPDYERLLVDVIGVFESHETVRPALLTKLLSAKDSRVRAYGTRVIGNWATQLPDALNLLKERVRDENPRVRLEAIVASSYVESPKAIEVATEALAHPQDRFIEYSLALASRSLQPHWQPALAAGKLNLGSDNARTEYLRKIASTTPPPPSPGQAVYETLCLNCHQPDGRGLAGIYPPLVNSEWVKGDNKEALVKMLLHGLTGPITVAGQEYGRQNPIPMPPSGLEDQQIADVLTYVRAEFGGNVSAVSPEEVAALRSAYKDRATFWTAAELSR